MKRLAIAFSVVLVLAFGVSAVSAQIMPYLHVGSVTDSSIMVYWWPELPPGASSWRVMRGAGSCSATSWTQIYSGSPPAGSYYNVTDTGLTSGTTYAYRLEVYNGSWAQVNCVTGTTTGNTPTPTHTPTPTSTPTGTLVPTATGSPAAATATTVPGPTAIGTATTTGTPGYNPVTVTPTPAPTAARIPDCIVKDFHFINSAVPGAAQSWTRTSGAALSLSSYTLQAGGSISQSIALTQTQSYSVSIRALAQAPGTLQVSIGDIVQAFEVTRTRNANFSFMAYSSATGTVSLSNVSGGPIVVDRICLLPSDTSAFGGLYGIQSSPFGGSTAGSPALGVDLAEMQDMFEPMSLSGGGGWTLFTGDWHTFMSQMARVFATFMVISTPNMLGFWIGARIVIIGALWFAGFVLQKIGRKIPDNGIQAIQVIPGMGWRVNTLNEDVLPRLPKLRMGSIGPRVFRSGGRRRRGGW